MKKLLIIIFSVILVNISIAAQEKKVYKKDIGVTYPLALDPDADIFGLYALKEAGVTRNVIIDRTGKIIFLTRLFDKQEFERMKKVIFSELGVK